MGLQYFVMLGISSVLTTSVRTANIIIVVVFATNYSGCWKSVFILHCLNEI